MVEWFELKTYKQLEVALAAANVVLLVALVLVGYYGVAASSDQVAIGKVLAGLSENKLAALLPVGLVATFWGWITTEIFRLHDRVHDPVIRKWRAGYDADFILRTLLAPWGQEVPKELFERAYADRRVRNKCLQRLFYRFIGDASKDPQARRLFFYSEMARYWFMGLVEIYSYLGIFSFAAYCYITRTPLNPVIVIALAASNLAARIYSNHVLDSAHEITIDQIGIIQRAKADDIHTEISQLLIDLGLRSAR